MGCLKSRYANYLSDTHTKGRCTLRINRRKLREAGYLLVENLDCDKLDKKLTGRQRICDYVLVLHLADCRSVDIIAVEMKGGKLTEKAIKQIEAGANLAVKLVQQSSACVIRDIWGLALKGRRISDVALQLMRSQAVRVQGKQVRVVVERCGCELISVVSRLRK